MSELKYLFTFSFFAIAGYILRTRNGRRLDTGVNASLSGLPALTKWSPLEFRSDPASRILLGIENTVLETSDVPSVFTDLVRARREEILVAYATGTLTEEIRSTLEKVFFEAHELGASIEAYKALNAFVTKQQRGLRFRRAYRTGLLSRLWSNCTITYSRNLATRVDGPCLLMDSPGEQVSAVEMEGAITFVTDNDIQLNFGEDSGLFSGDIVRVERSQSREWIGCAIIQTVKESNSTAIFMGDQPPHVGDCATATISTISPWSMPE